MEIRYRSFWVYVNDLAGYTKKVPEAVFAFTLEEIEALEAWVPFSDGFRKEVIEAKEEFLLLNLRWWYNSLKKKRGLGRCGIGKRSLRYHRFSWGMGWLGC